MPRFFFNLIGDVDTLLDPEGVEMPLAAVPDAALQQARDCLAADVKEGRLNLRYRIDVYDEAGQPVHSMSFERAVDVTPR